MTTYPDGYYCTHCPHAVFLHNEDGSCNCGLDCGTFPKDAPTAGVTVATQPAPEVSCCELACYEDPGCACEGCAEPAEDGPCVRCGYLRDSGTHDTAETCDAVRGPCLDPQRHHPYQSARSAPAALDAFVPLLTSCCHDMGLSEADIRVLSARLANSPATLAQPAPDDLRAPEGRCACGHDFATCTRPEEPR